MEDLCPKKSAMDLDAPMVVWRFSRSGSGKEEYLYVTLLAMKMNLDPKLLLMSKSSQEERADVGDAQGEDQRQQQH